MKLFVAGNYEEFRRYCKENRIPMQDARYISDSDSIRGFRGKWSDVVFVGSWDDDNRASAREGRMRMLAYLHTHFREEKENNQ